jgi:hypothetical protein
MLSARHESGGKSGKNNNKSRRDGCKFAFLEVLYCLSRRIESEYGLDRCLGRIGMNGSRTVERDQCDAGSSLTSRVRYLI